jgi:Fe-S oxidoreductase
MKNDPFYEATKKILNYIPGVKIVELKGMCGHTGFEQINRETKDSALRLINEAKNKGANVIVCTSPYCESHLLMSQRKGAWRSVDIEITDVYRLLLSSLEGDI